MVPSCLQCEVIPTFPLVHTTTRSSRSCPKMTRPTLANCHLRCVTYFFWMLSLINAKLVANNRPPVRFVNPLLIHRRPWPEASNDITVGDNKCTNNQCCKFGFAVCAGWDPASGLRSIQFAIDKLVEFALRERRPVETDPVSFYFGHSSSSTLVP